MAKSIKISDEVYLDSSSVIHNRKKLKDILESIAETITPVILYDGGTTGTNGNFTLNDSWKNYKYIEIFYTRMEYEIGSTKAPTDLANNDGLPINAVCCHYGYGTGFWTGWKKFNFSVSNPKQVTVTYGNGYVTETNQSFKTNTENTIRVLRVLGYK